VASNAILFDERPDGLLELPVKRGCGPDRYTGDGERDKKGSKLHKSLPI
jgi:hypothetical protein